MYFDNIEPLDIAFDRLEGTASKLMRDMRTGSYNMIDNLYAILKAYGILTDSLDKNYELYKESKSSMVKQLMSERFLRNGLRLLLDGER